RNSASFLENLAAAGVAPGSIDFVLCTHLHIDHCGWNTRLINGRWVPTFPNAKYLMSRREHDAAKTRAEKENLRIYDESVLPVICAGQAVLVDMDHVIDDEVRLEPTSGHTPGHVAVRLALQDERGIVTGDIFHSPIQCVHPDWNFRYDVDPELARL